MSQSVAPEAAETETTERQVKPYDFQRHEAMDRSRLRRLAPVLEVAAHRVAQSLTSIVRASIKVEMADLEQARWEVFANSLPEPTFLATATVTPIGGRVALHAPLELAQALVELRLGGTVTGRVQQRALTDIELRLFAEVAEAILSETFQALSVVVPMQSGPMAAMSSALLVQMPNPSEICLLVKAVITIEELTKFEAVVSLPLSVLLALLDAIERIENAELNETDSTVTEVRARLLEAPVDITISFPDIVLSTDELLSLGIGDVISLHRPEGLPVRLNVSGSYFCDVVPTTQGKRLACLVVESKTQEDQ
ncbi:MAG TPA: flagellar motor switch protein FliM [Acidimicrobiales bacterium]|jgi:flagellar motor switch protein FliM|nr:flagellar motor switch protein FliM [Acidimicrobiales bacterium]